MQTNGTESKWKEAVEGLLGVTLNKFFPKKFGGDVLSEILCEPLQVCNFNEILFKGYATSWLAVTGQLIPSSKDRIKPKLRGSADALAQSCTGMGNNTCGVRWYPRKWDGTVGMEQEISASGCFSANLLIDKGSGPVTDFTGGDSESDPNAGQDSSNQDQSVLKPITTGDKAGAGILTALFIPGWVALMAWMILGG